MCLLQSNFGDPGRRWERRGGLRDGVQGGRAPLGDLPAYASAWEELGISRDLSRRHVESAANSSQVRFQLADLLHPRRAAGAAKGHETRGHRALRQFNE